MCLEYRQCSVIGFENNKPRNIRIMIVFKPVWLGLCVVVLLSLLACNTTPTKPSLKAAGNRSGPTAVEHVELASQAIDRWRQHFKTADLQQAYFHYSQARKTFPHNAELQRYHYNSAYYLALAGVGEQVELQHVFNELNEWVKTQVNPPSKIRYAKIHDNESTAVEEIAALKPVIREQPYNAHSWFRLSLALEENKQSWVASFAARRAFELNDDVDYRYNYGESLVNIAYSTSACHYDDEAFLKKAAKYMAIASGKKEEAYYLDNIALNYLSLGLFPLAHREAKKAFMAEKTYWTSLRYAHSSELVGDYDAARIAGDYLLNELNLADGAQILARVSFQEQNLAEAAAYMQLYYELSLIHISEPTRPY